MRYAMPWVLAVLVVASPVVCCAHIVTVDCDGGADYLTIQEAVNAASGGDTIAIAACVYEEQVLIPDIPLVMVGEGAAATEITWSGAGGTVEFQQSDLALHNLTVRHEADFGRAVTWDEQTLTLSSCVVSGRVDGGQYYGKVVVSGSDVEWLEVCGGFRTSTVEQSEFGYAAFYAPWQTCHTLNSSGSRYGRLVPCLSYCSGDTIGRIHLTGVADAAEYLEATASRIDTLTGWFSAHLELSGCEVGVFTYEAAHETGPLFQVSDCLFTGDVDVVADYKRGTGAAGGSRGYSFEHNTILGQLMFDMATSEKGFNDFIRSNIVVGPSVINCQYDITVSHNDFAGGLTIDAPAAQVEANIYEDPQFCDAPFGDYTVHENSPCNGAAHDGSVIGAFPVGCYVPVQRASWGRIKAQFR